MGDLEAAKLELSEAKQAQSKKKGLLESKSAYEKRVANAQVAVDDAQAKVDRLQGGGGMSGGAGGGMKAQIALVMGLISGLANVSTQLSLVIGNLTNPPVGTFEVFQDATRASPFHVNYVSTDNVTQDFGFLTLPGVVPSTGEKYVTVPGAGTFEGGVVTVENANGYYQPYTVITAQKVVYNCPRQDLLPAGPLNFECSPSSPGLAFALIAIAFAREALILGVFCFCAYKKQLLVKKIEPLAKSSLVGIIWFSGAMTQEQFRKDLQEKKLVDLPPWFKAGNGLLDLAGTNIGVAMSSQSVEASTTSGQPVPASAVTMLVTGPLALFGGIVQAGVFIKDKCKERSKGSNPAVQMTSP